MFKGAHPGSWTNRIMSNNKLLPTFPYLLGSLSNIKGAGVDKRTPIPLCRFVDGFLGFQLFPNWYLQSASMSSMGLDQVNLLDMEGVYI